MLLLDEPLGALDLKLRKQMQTELARIHRQVGTTFVFVTHDQEEALSMATRIAIMSGGKVLQEGTPREVYDQPGQPVRRQLRRRHELPRRHGPAGPTGQPVLDLGGGDRSTSRAMRTDGPGDAHGPTRVPEAPSAEEPTRPTGAGITGRDRQRRLPRQPHAGHGRHAGGEVVVVRPHGTRDPTTNDRNSELGEEVCVWWLAENAALIRD